MPRTSAVSQDGSRFSVLLNPIRDISESWCIDVAKVLSEYAETLGIDLNQSGGDNDGDSTFPVLVDFAEAALLVQGSTSIYSRKVEHLYGLVFTAVSAMNRMSGNGQGSRDCDREAMVKSASADDIFDVDKLDFLSLNDDLPQADPESITLSGQLERLNGRDETLLKAVPPLLVQRSSGAKRQLGAVTYRMSTARIHSSGALIMAGCPPVNGSLDTLPEDGDLEPDGDITQPFDNNFAGQDDFEDVDNNNGALSPCPVDHDESGTPPHLAEQKDRSAPGFESRSLEDTAKQYGVSSGLSVKKRPKTTKEAFILLDPHEATPQLDKPLKVGKTSRKPRKSSAPVRLTDEEDHRLVETTLRELPNKLSVKSYVSFRGIRDAYAAILKGRTQKRRRAKSASFGQTTYALLQDGVDENLDVDVFRSGDEGPADLDSDDGIDSPEHLRFVGDRGPTDDHPDLGLFADPANELQLDSQLAYLASSYEETCRRHLLRTAQMWEQRTADTELLRRVNVWTARIQPILDAEEQRKEFDISVYGQRIIDTMADIGIKANDTGTRVSALLMQPEKFETSRHFLALLQLANNYKLEIVPPPECGVSDFLVVATQVRVKSTVSSSKALNSGILVVKTPDAAGVKRSRVSGTTPKSARRNPSRPRIQVRATALR